VDRIQTSLLCSVLWIACPFASSFSLSTEPAQQSQSAEQTSSQAQPQSPSQAPAQEKGDSLAEAARKAKAKKAAAAKGKVFTEEDLSGMNRNGVSVVGTESKKTALRPPAKQADVNSTENGEEYWRGKARPFLNEMAEIDQQIAQLKEEIKKYGAGGFDIVSNYRNSIAYLEDRNAQIQVLQKRKATLQKQFDDLEEEGRKAGAQPAWFR